MRDMLQQIETAKGSGLGLVTSELGQITIMARHPVGERFGGILMIEHVQDRCLVPKRAHGTWNLQSDLACPKQTGESLTHKTRNLLNLSRQMNTACAELKTNHGLA